MKEGSSVFYFEHKVITDYSGYNQLCRLYHHCLQQEKETVTHLDFSGVDWFDGNMCALLAAILYKLNLEHRLTFTTDEKMIREKFDVLFRNGFLNKEAVVDDRKSTVRIQSFDCNDKEGFCKYVNEELLAHRGMPDDLDDEVKEKINEDLLEILCNTHYHANTTKPVFVGGQYYPQQRYLKFTMVDMGDGFLPRVMKATAGAITSDLSAILWALQGNSTKRFLDHCPGGLGIQSMHKYCRENQGVLQVISNNGFWSSDLENTIFEEGRELGNVFGGTTINLLFQKK